MFPKRNIKAQGTFERQYLKKISFGSQLMEKDSFCCGNKRTVKTKANRREDGLLALKVEELLVAT